MKPINLTIANEEERKTILNALNHYGNYCLDMYEYAIQKGSSRMRKRPYSHEEIRFMKKRSDLCFAMQERLGSEESNDPFCANCKEDHCEVSDDWMCKMLRVYLGE